MARWNSPGWIAGFLSLLFLYFSGLSTLPLLDRDEPRFAEATREMIEQSRYLVPHFNGVPRYDKPPGIYWTMIPFYRVLGPGELAARLPVVLSTFALLAFVGTTSTRLFGPRAAFLAMLGLGTSLQLLLQGRLAVADTPMVLFVSLTHYSLFRLLHRPATSLLRWQLFLYVSLALGFLFKGPVAWLVPLGSVLLHRYVFCRSPLPWRHVGLAWGIPFCLALTSLWAVPALQLTHGQWARVGLGEHVLARGWEAFNGRLYIPFYYFVTLWISLFPWSGFIPAVVQYSLKHRHDPRISFLWAWFLSPILLFSFYATQLPHYILPGFPAFFLLFGAAWKEKPSPSSFDRAFLCVFLIIFVLLAGVLSFLAKALSPCAQKLSFLLASLSLLLLAWCVLGLLAFHGKESWAYLPVLVGAISMGIFASELRNLSPSLILGQALRAHPCPCPYVAKGFEEPSLVFYSRHLWIFEDASSKGSPLASPPTKLAECKGELQAVEEKSLSTYLRILLEKKSSPEISQYFPNKGKETPGAVVFQGLNVARFSWVWLTWKCPRSAPAVPPKPTASPN
ncbi:ArnT family glycosyltransferase [Candidatus Methylacidithermus pantelleriae]|uniref:Putative PMT_2 domain-containing protein n=1 Tax=Candidatus Methylacidithermus pantelleriae TaxID=2744239 RepID=A0A8J2FPB1_9BACT|nr:glycosyltransferase family 39 protein [Candidatus Methylacidithermus pantelleriae]CAF0701113.1 putative PMT_2 domain-containing protein [Candidatus Methylacidithermus pantelleriae]